MLAGLLLVVVLFLQKKFAGSSNRCNIVYLMNIICYYTATLNNLYIHFTFHVSRTSGHISRSGIVHCVVKSVWHIPFFLIQLGCIKGKKQGEMGERGQGDLLFLFLVKWFVKCLLEALKR